MSEPEGTFAVVKLPNGTWVGAHASGRRIEIRDWTDIDRARARWHLAPRWAADGLYVFSDAFGPAPEPRGYNYVTTPAPRDEDDSDDGGDEYDDGFDDSGEGDGGEGPSGGSYPGVSRADIEKHISAERAEIDREKARLGGVGPIQRQQLEAEIAQRERIIENLQQQLLSMP